MADKTNSKTQILEYLKKNIGKDISRDFIRKKYNLSTSRLSEVINMIRADGYQLTTPPRSGIVRLDTANTTEILPSIKDSDIRQWTIIFILSVYNKLTFTEILTKLLSLKDSEYLHRNLLINSSTNQMAYDNAVLIKNLRENISDDDQYTNVAKDIISVTALRNDLTKLKSMGLITIKRSRKTTYQLTNKAPVIIQASEDNLYEAWSHYEDSSSAKDVDAIKNVYTRIQNMLCLEENTNRQRRFGRRISIGEDQIEAFNYFADSTYKTNLLKFNYKTGGETISFIFGTGLIYFSTETSCFYVLGKNISTDVIEVRRLDRIITVEELPDKNTEFQKSKYIEYYNEIFTAGYDKTTYKVKVLVSDFKNVPRRFQNLTAIRTKSSFYEISNPPEDCDYKYIYEDTIRNLHEFARYLRSFGYSVLALEPPELTQKMIETYERILNKYEETNE